MIAWYREHQYNESYGVGPEYSKQSARYVEALLCYKERLLAWSTMKRPKAEDENFEAVARKALHGSKDHN